MKFLLSFLLFGGVLDPSGTDRSGMDPAGVNPVGLDRIGLDPAGLAPIGMAPVGLDPVGMDPVGLDPVGLAPAGMEEATAGPARIYEVWKLRQNIHESPHSFSRIIARAEKGAKLAVLEEQARWGRVSLAASGAQGWTILDAPAKKAGSRFESLEGAASPTGVAAAVKAFDDLAREVGELLPDVEKLFLEFRDAYLEFHDVADFAQAGGLPAPESPGDPRNGEALNPIRAPSAIPKDTGDAMPPVGDTKTPEARQGSDPSEGKAPPLSQEKPRSIEEEIERARDRMRSDVFEPRNVEDFSEDDERRIGEATARAILARYRCLSPSDPLSIYVWKVGSLLVERTSRPWIPYRFIVLESREVNAFAAPYGHVFVTTGALAFVRNEAELAMVLAHEIAHVEKKHGLAMLVKARLDIMKRGARARLDALSRPLEGEAKKTRDSLEREMDRLSDLVLKGQGLPLEREADRIGIELISRAGYDPTSAVEFFARLSKAQGPTSEKPEIFMSHPCAGERIADARAVAEGLPTGGATLADRYRKSTQGRV